MRRADREITDPEKIRSIITRCFCCRLGFCDHGRAYIVPMSFGFSEENGVMTFYFHSAAEGRKLSLIRESHTAGFELDTGYALHTAQTACGHSAAFQSVIGTGRVTFIEDEAEKITALEKIMLHNTGREQWDFTPAMTQGVCVFQLTVEDLSCKEHQ